MRIAEIIKTECSFHFNGEISGLGQAEVSILALIPANMEVPVLQPGDGFLSEERRNLILGRNAGLDECRKALGGK